MKKFLPLLFLMGCTPINSFVNLQNAQAIKDAQATNDNLIVGISAGICEVPVGAVLRNPSFIPVVQAACNPGGALANTTSLLQPNGGTPVYQQTLNAMKKVP